MATRRPRSGTGQRTTARPPSPPGPGLFRDIVLAPDRDVAFAPHPLISVGDEDPADFRGEARRRTRERYELVRRGEHHGHLAELEPGGIVPRRERRRRREALLSERWHAARPLALPGIAQGLAQDGSLRRRAGRAWEALSQRGGLLRWLEEAQDLGDFAVTDPAAPLADPERDLDRVLLREREIDGLWLKSSRLSLHPADLSLRLRASFGEEGADDASRDEVRHAAVARLARRVIPGARELEKLSEPREFCERWLTGGVRFAQHIGYWNAPGGGARMHHDAFDEELVGGQRGVLYVQLSGRTVWLALSIEDLGLRVREAFDALGEDPSEQEAWFGKPEAWSELVPIVQSRKALLAELGQPGCGRLAPVVDRGPEFTCMLVDAGHGIVLHPGDGLLLPNHGLDRTAMHSVFCGSDEVTYGLSAALRERVAGPRS